MKFINLFVLGIKSIFFTSIKLGRYFFIGLLNIITLIPKYFIIGIKAIFGKKKGVKVSKENKKLSMYIIGTSTCIYLICVFLQIFKLLFTNITCFFT